MKIFYFLLFFFYSQLTFADHYCVIMSSDSQSPNPIYSHVWATFIDDETLNQFTISWSPKTKWRISDQKVEGYNKSLKDTIEDALKFKRNIVLFGPFKIKEEYFLKAENLYHELEAGKYNYKAIDHRSRKNIEKPALNCIHAVSDIGGYFSTKTKFGSQAAISIVEFFKQNNIIQPISNEEILRILELEKYTQIKRR